MNEINWNDYPHFSESEFTCSHTGKCEMSKEFMDILNEIRLQLGSSMIITSGYRHPTHPVEASKKTRGEHTYGVCCDVLVRGAKALKIIKLAQQEGITRIGVSQKGDSRFLHLGIGFNDLFPSPALWSY